MEVVRARRKLTSIDNVFQFWPKKMGRVGGPGGGFYSDDMCVPPKS